MSIETGGPAFPKAGLDAWNQAKTIHPGMTLRDYFAAKAMQGLMTVVDCEKWEEKTARIAYMVADAMIKERAKCQ